MRPRRPCRAGMRPPDPERELLAEQLRDRELAADIVAVGMMLAFGVLALALTAGIAAVLAWLL